MVQYRAAVSADLDRLAPLAEAFVRERAATVGAQTLKEDFAAAAREMLAGALAHPATFVVVAEADGQPVGYASGAIQEPPPIFVDQPYLFVSDVYVVPEHRGQGIGAKLVERVRGFGLIRGILRTSMVVPVADAAAQRIVQKLGFAPVEQLYFWQG